MGDVSDNLLLRILRVPGDLAQLDLADWDVLLRLARLARVEGRLAFLAEREGIDDAVPERVRQHLESARVVAVRHRRVIEWEVRQIEAVLSDVESPMILLKGGAYIMAGLDAGRGRMSSDLDLLFEKAALPEVERTLLAAGWRIAELDPLDQRYFRQWLHELPPLVHGRRRTMLDVHHTILPRTDTLQVDPQRLLDAAQTLAGRRAKILAPADMVLHSAAHLFRNGDFGMALRDLADLDSLLREFSVVEGFWDRLIARAKTLDLRLPCFCGLRFVQRYFQTPVPDAVNDTIGRWRPGAPPVWLIDALVDRALIPHVEGPTRRRSMAISLLAHWPVPRLRTMMTGVFWSKRLPSFRKSQERA